MSGAGEQPVLTVYGRAYCHLCGEMVAQLEALRPVLSFVLRVVDVDEDGALAQRYGEWVPVLVGGDGEEICHYHLDSAALAAYFSKIR